MGKQMILLGKKINWIMDKLAKHGKLFTVKETAFSKERRPPVTDFTSGKDTNYKTVYFGDAAVCIYGLDQLSEGKTVEKEINPFKRVSPTASIVFVLEGENQKIEDLIKKNYPEAQFVTTTTQKNGKVGLDPFENAIQSAFDAVEMNETLRDIGREKPRSETSKLRMFDKRTVLKKDGIPKWTSASAISKDLHDRMVKQITQLVKEEASRWPYPNKAQKLLKAEVLWTLLEVGHKSTALLKYKYQENGSREKFTDPILDEEKQSLRSALDTLKTLNSHAYQTSISGKVSTRTRELLEQFEREIQPDSSPKKCSVLKG